MIIKLRNFFFISSEDKNTIRKMKYVMSTLNCQKKGNKLLKTRKCWQIFPLMHVREFLGNNVHFVLQDTILGPKLKLKEQNEKTCINYLQQQFSMDHHERFQLRKEWENYYDSLFHVKINGYIKMQVCNLCKCPKDEVVIKVTLVNNKLML